MRLTGEDGLLPVNVLTGFLGSGKTTLLRKILTEESYGDTAVLINELGEVGLDQVLVGEIAPDILLLNSGCLCCTLRGELRDALANLLTQRLEGKIPPFKRVIVETTGLAKPALILSTVFADPSIRHHFTIGSIATTVDCLHSSDASSPPIEWLEQIVAADTLVLTKQDLVHEARIAQISAMLNMLNPSATLKMAIDIHTATLFSQALGSTAIAATQHTAGPFSALLSKKQGDPATTAYKPFFNHDISTSTVHISEKTPIDWESFGVWLSMLLHAHGEKLLRIKGIIQIEGNSEPVVIQGVQHVIYPPEHLSSWGQLPRQTDLVFISRNLPSAQIKKSFDSFVLKKPTQHQE